jgi:uncharacterized protein
MFVTAVRTLPDRGSTSGPVEPEPTGRGGSMTIVRSRQRLVLLGTFAGGLSGLLGVGGGVLMVPGFNQVLGMPLRTAIATSLVCAGAFAVPATITHAILGTIDWHVAILLTVGAVPGAHLGASMSIRFSDRRLRIAVAVVIGIVAVTYATGELVALVTGTG